MSMHTNTCRQQHPLPTNSKSHLLASTKGSQVCAGMDVDLCVSMRVDMCIDMCVGICRPVGGHVNIFRHWFCLLVDGHVQCFFCVCARHLYTRFAVRTGMCIVMCMCTSLTRLPRQPRMYRHVYRPAHTCAMEMCVDMCIDITKQKCRTSPRACSRLHTHLIQANTRTRARTHTHTRMR